MRMVKDLFLPVRNCFLGFWSRPKKIQNISIKLILLYQLKAVAYPEWGQQECLLCCSYQCYGRLCGQRLQTDLPALVQRPDPFQKVLQ